MEPTIRAQALESADYEAEVSRGVKLSHAAFSSQVPGLDQTTYAPTLTHTTCDASPVHTHTYPLTLRPPAHALTLRAPSIDSSDASLCARPRPPSVIHHPAGCGLTLTSGSRPVRTARCLPLTGTTPRVSFLELLLWSASRLRAESDSVPTTRFPFSLHPTPCPPWLPLVRRYLLVSTPNRPRHRHDRAPSSPARLPQYWGKWVDEACWGAAVFFIPVHGDEDGLEMEMDMDTDMKGGAEQNRAQGRRFFALTLARSPCSFSSVGVGGGVELSSSFLILQRR
ncbi:hypothetical protein C8F04DRAFT_1401070 [Mycena alexandri]|uniref:Uncharacterized protein n=1 Tax=Mycena alexandri TaxID=1745969 RepID=A0AAD6SFH9_9AGAR|nr:hypothetical protein C8F04DRAFT_1401070 [Mycena alexandri]